MQEAEVELVMAPVEQEPPELRLIVSPAVELMDLENVKSISMAAPSLYAPSDTIEVMLVIVGLTVFHGGMVMPVLSVARRLPRVSAIVPLPLWEYVTMTPVPPDVVILATVRTTLVLSEPGATEVTVYVVPNPVLVTVNPPSFGLVIVEALASLLRVTVI